MSGSLTFMCGRSRHNEWIKGSVDGWEWSTRGAGYEGDRDFFSVHWQIDLPKGFFVEWEIDTPKDHPCVSPVAVLLHVASPRHEADPVLNDLKREVIDALLHASIEQQVNAKGVEFEVGPYTSVDKVRKNKTTQAFGVRLNPTQATPSYKADIMVVHAIVGEDVDQVVRNFADRLRSRFGS